MEKHLAPAALDGFSLLHIASCVLYPSAHGSGQFEVSDSCPGGSKKRRLSELLLAARVGPSVQDSL